MSGRKPRKQWGWLPDGTDEFLIKAAVEDGDQAIAAWGEWKRRRSLDEAGHAAFLILPLVYRNLTGLSLQDPELGRIRGVYRFTWSRNQLLLHLGGIALRDLRQAGIETIVLKGAALSVSQYRDLGVRQMGDFDVLVPRRRVTEAIDALRVSLEPHPASPHPEE